MKHFTLKNILYTLFVSFVTFTLLTGIRFFTAHEEHTHFHANFGIFINGGRLDFSNAKYMEEVSSCTVSGALQPKQRVHLHNNIGDVIHVHNEGVTWGHFFNNINFTINDKVLTDDKGILYQTNETTKLRFILNGSQIDSIFNKLIASEDKLLIDYSSDSLETLKNQKYSQIIANAGEYNEKQDPAGCSGGHELTVQERLKRAILF